MLVDEYAMVVKGLYCVSEADAMAILDTILEQTKENLKATIVDVWQAQDAQNGIILRPMICKGKNEKRELRPFQISDTSRGIFTWVVEKHKAVWVERVREQIAQGYLLDQISNEKIEGRYLYFYEQTNTLLAVPIYYREKLRGLLSVESPVSNQFNNADLETLRDLALPTGILLWKLDTFSHNCRQTKEAIDSFRASINRSTMRLNHIGPASSRGFLNQSLRSLPKSCRTFSETTVFERRNMFIRQVVELSLTRCYNKLPLFILGTLI